MYAETNDFPWNGSVLLAEEYNKNNYRIIETGSTSNKAIVFFSSNGIYFPNTEAMFAERIVQGDYYDWANLSAHREIQKYFRKIVFVRDIYKQWYITGINSKVNNIEKLKDFLAKELEGMEITTCGSSAGGYISVLMGVLLGAERIIDSCGQHNLMLEDDCEPYICKGKNDPEVNKYFDLKSHINGQTDVIYYFYPSECEADIIQCSDVGDKIVKKFMVQGNKHGDTIRPICFPYVLTMDKNRLDALWRKHNGQVVDKKTLFSEIVPLGDRASWYVSHIAKKLHLK